MSAQRPLRYARLIEISQPGAVPLTSSALRADERIVNYLKGLNVMDDRSRPGCKPLSPAAEAPLAASQQAVVRAVVERLRQSAAQLIVPVVQLIGADTASRLAVARHTCARD